MGTSCFALDAFACREFPVLFCRAFHIVGRPETCSELLCFYIWGFLCHRPGGWPCHVPTPPSVASCPPLFSIPSCLLLWRQGFLHQCLLPVEICSWNFSCYSSGSRMTCNSLFGDGVIQSST